MKKSLFVLLLGISQLCIAQVIPNQLYVYQGGNVINTFFVEDIDSITYSTISIDSTICETYVTQEVHMLDTVYRFDLISIDSISLITPQTVYQPGVIKLEGNLRSYIIAVDSLTLSFKSETPVSVLPKVGDKLVTMELDEIITEPFLGQVIKITQQSGNYIVDCEAVSLTDIFDTYFSTSFYSVPISYAAQRINADGFYSAPNTINPGEQMLAYINTPNVSYEKNEKLGFSISGEHKAYISVTPTINYAASLCVQKEQGTTITVRTISDLHWHKYFALSGSLSASADGQIWASPAIKIPQALVDIDFAIGWYASASGEICTEQDWKQHYRHTFLFSWNNKGNTVLKNINKLQQISHSHNGLLAINGNVKAGLDAKVRISFICTKDLDIANINSAIKAGIALEGTFVPYKKDAEYAKKNTDLYNQIKNDKIRIGVEIAWAPLEVKFFKWSISPFPDIPIVPPNNLPHYEWNTVPTFSDVKLEKNSDGTYFAFAKIAGNVLKTDAGFALLNQTNQENSTYIYCKKNYTNQAGDMAEMFPDKSPADSYRLYPLVKYMGIELLAEPSAELLLCPDYEHAHDIDLGLSVNWSCMNVGATIPEEIGDYFAYAETSPKNSYTQNNYLYYNYNSGSSYYTSLGTADISGTVYDAAKIKWGNDWRMPTTNEIKELVDNCTWTWTTRNSVEGYEVTGPNGNSIFLPFAPVMSGTSSGSVCYYRSSLYNSDTYGNVYFAGSDAIKFLKEQMPSKGSVLRFMGAVIRPVKTKPQTEE